MIRSLRIASALLPVLGLLGCVAGVDPTDAPEGLDIPLIDAGSPEEVGVLALVNDPATTFELLDVDVGLDRRAAAGLIAGRPFASITAVDAVPYVGRVALDRLLAWARAGGLIPATGDRDAATLALVNDPATTFTLLDDDVRLDRRAAQNIIDRRPFATLAELDAVPYVGASALAKLGDYALANGYGEADPGPEPARCVIISEYVEGQGSNNKAVELYNCGAEPVALESIGICLVRNGDTTCSRYSVAGVGALAAGAVWTMCRTMGGTFNDPFTPLATACDYEGGSALSFNGDDRLVVFHDADANGRMDSGETVLDRFGDPAAQPAGRPWSETNLRRCDLSPMADDPSSKFSANHVNDFTDLGVPPVAGCGSTLAAAGEDCVDAMSCEAGLRCFGRPFDGSTELGKCVDVTPIAGEGASCDSATACGDGLICAGWTVWGSGDCVPRWMSGRWETEPESAIPESGSLRESVVVYGLASVPVDIEVQVHIDHPRRTDLRVTLLDPNGVASVLWDRSTELAEYSRSFALSGISRDDQVNGRWTLQVEDLVTGQTGTLESFRLFVVSRWD